MNILMELPCLKRGILLLLTLLITKTILGQNQLVSGTVKDSDGLPLTGVSILIKNSTQGTVSDAAGKYSITAASGDILVYSFIGYITREVTVGNQSVIDLILDVDIQQPGEVFVTALGISRTHEALQSAVTKVPGISLTRAKENNLGTSLQGRVAGVEVSKANTGPAGSSRVIIRGNKSFNSGNQPLYVVDGIPMDNTQFGRAGFWGGIDQGDGLTSINPEDIESVTILKGAAAAALYGSRGGFGVINIVTKRGTSRKGIGVELASSYVFEKVHNLSDLQKVYGPGGLANSDPDDFNSPRIYSKAASQLQAWNWGAGSMWGPKLDGSPVIQFDGIARPYSYAGDNWKRFYETGHSLTNSLAISGGNEKQTFRFSFSDMRSTFIIPNSGFSRKSISLAANGKFGEKVLFNARVLYSNEEIKNRMFVADSPGNAVHSIWNLANTVNVYDLRGDPNKQGAVAPGVTTPDLKSAGEEFQQANNNWLQNPWWIAYQFKNTNIKDRLVSSANLRYNIFKWLYIQGQVGMDWYTRNNDMLTPQGTGYSRGGEKRESSNFVREINQELMLGFEKKFGRFQITSFAGGNKMVRELETIEAYGQTFNIPFYTSISNTSSQRIIYDFSKSGINSLYGSAEIGYNRYLYITATARNDWFSVLNPAHNSAFYPSIGASFVLTDAFPRLSELLSFGKIRAAWGQVATANVGPYSGKLTYSLIGQGHLGLPIGATGDGSLPNPTLSPALSSELEFGTEMKFLKGRLGFDLTYYDQKTTGDFLWASISKFSGFWGTMFNVGKLSNRGIEILINAVPFIRPVNWDISMNLALNKNKVVYLDEFTTQIDIDRPRTGSVMIRNITGYPFGMITGSVQKTDADGTKIYDSYGQPVRSAEFEILGNGVADVTGGLINSLTYKGISLNILIDFKFGGDIYSGTNVRLTQWGLHKQTLENREGGIIVEGATQTGTNADGSPAYEPFSSTLNQEQIKNYWYNLGERCQENFIYDASFVKLRQVSLEYTLPGRILSKTPFSNLTLSLSGRNLAILYKNIDNVDPESSYSDSNAQGLDYFAMPGTRTYGFNLRVAF